VKVCQVCPEVCQVDSQVVVCPEDNLKEELIKDLKSMKLIDFSFKIL
jgi:NifB/MoaA-like Fe-S oxidoreductase